jgi:hypothetical protein
MERREILAVLGLGTLGLVGSRSGEALAQDQPVGLRHESHGILDECARTCNETSSHCLHLALQGGGVVPSAHLKAHEAMMDCQAFCHLTSALNARKSPMASYAHRACAEACRDCAQACEKGQDEVMKRCAEVCRRCEQHCRQHSQQVERAAARS